MTGPFRAPIVRPGQLRIGPLGIGIVALRDDEATLQFMVGAEPPTRTRLEPGGRTEVDGWTVSLLAIETADRGSVIVEVSAPER